MNRTLVLDSGAIVAAQNNDRAITRLIDAARRRGALVLIPSGVIAETWRGSASQARISSVIRAAHAVPPLDVEAAKRVGVLLAHASRASAVDGSVADVALSNAPSLIATSDPDDMRALLRGVSKADVKVHAL
jgi:hypothetical protein